MPQAEARLWIERLGLERHPEGGYYRETYRAEETFQTARGLRSASTAIFYLLESGDVSRLHRIRSDEMWHFYAGSPLTVHLFHGEGTYEALPVCASSPQAMVPAGAWFGATVDESRTYTLAGCTVSPGFEFEDLEMAERDPMTSRFPGQREIIERLTG